MTFNDSFDDFMSLYTEGYNPKDKAYNRTPEDCESCGCSDEEVEDCETCGCEEKPEYGHLDDTYSNYINRYKEPAEDAEYDMGEVLDAIADDIKAGMTRAELEANHGADNVWKFMQYLAVDRRGRPTNKTNPRPHVNRKVVNNIKNTKGPDPIEDEDAEGKIDKDRMKCNKPRRTSGGSKKFVVKACENGNEKIVRFGDPNMRIRKSNPKARKSFRARHKCDQKKSKFSAGYWSCKKW